MERGFTVSSQQPSETHPAGRLTVEFAAGVDDGRAASVVVPAMGRTVRVAVVTGVESAVVVATATIFPTSTVEAVEAGAGAGLSLADAVEVPGAGATVETVGAGVATGLATAVGAGTLTPSAARPNCAFSQVPVHF